MIDSLIKLAMLPITVISVLLDPSVTNKYLPNCLIKYFFNIECWGCGMTRAILELSKFNIQNAIKLNLFSPIVVILIISIFFKEVSNKGKKKWLNLQ